MSLACHGLGIRADLADKGTATSASNEAHRRARKGRSARKMHE
ncbi:hypothetical protein HMPREF9420_1676 [Segatella salivae DSM 15606]|uniref:Uncharacterized protein n=1 Tax=Segatella salivae DSM 15606 TaxID=888832 RepID=E6MQA8_9BACT|nr:hypothetical protein HMPREF9420_1676 [Segatella salivae DSM 15606]